MAATDLTIDVGGGAGGKGGSGGNGGSVNIDSAGSLVTRGALAHGIFGQSVGGGVGGGAAPVTANDQLHDNIIESAISVGGSGGSGGDGRTVTIANNTGGDIETFGDLTFSIFLQSVGGGGGWQRPRHPTPALAIRWR